MEDRSEPLLRFKLREVLTGSEVYTLIILSAYTLFALILWGSIEKSLELILLNTSILMGIISVATIDTKFNAGRIFKIFRSFYIFPLIFLIYAQVQYYIRVVNPGMFDELLVSWDYFIFGLNPTQYLHQFSFPFLTEYFQISYFMYFFMPLYLGIELHYKKKENEINKFAAMILFSFYLSYLLYFALPAIGPRFSLHDYWSIDLEMPGLFFTDMIRNVIDKGATIYPGIPINEDIINRDCMPSGHTMITLVNMILAFEFRSKMRWVILVIGTSLIISTVYLRYHYVVDVLAGIILALLVYFIEPKIRSWIKSRGFTHL